MGALNVKLILEGQCLLHKECLLLHALESFREHLCNRGANIRRGVGLLEWENLMIH